MTGALWRHDRRWLATWFVVCTTIFVAAWYQRGNEVWIPDLEKGFRIRWAVVVTTALALGLYASLRDRMAGTREHLAHRSWSAARVLFQRFVSCAFVLTLSLLSTHLFSWLGWLEKGMDIRELWSVERLGAHAAWFSAGLPALAAGLTLGLLGGPWWRALLEGALLAGGCAVVLLVAATLRVLAAPGADHVSPAAYTAVCLGLCLVLLLLASGSALRSHDRDRGAAIKRPALAAASLACAAAACATAALRVVQYDRVLAIERGLPHVILDAAGTLEVLSMRGSWPGRTWHRTGPDGANLGPASLPFDEKTGELLPGRSPYVVALFPGGLGWTSLAMRSQFSLRDFPLRPRAATLGIGSNRLLSDATLVHRQGADHWDLVGSHWVPTEVPRRLRPKGERFPVRREDGQLLSGYATWIWSRGPRLLALDAADGALWQSSKDELVSGRPLRRFAGPPGGAILDVATRSGSFVARPTRGEAWPPAAATELQARTADGWFALHGSDTWRPIADVARWSHPLYEQAGWVPWGGHIETHSPAPLRLDMTAFDPAGQELLHHRFQPRGTWQGNEDEVALATAVSPAGAALLAWLPGTHAEFMAPYVADRSNGEVLLASLLIGAACALIVLFRLRRFDMPWHVAATWVVATLLGGLAVFMLQWGVVRRRAWNTAIPTQVRTPRRVPQRHVVVESVTR